METLPATFEVFTRRTNRVRAVLYVQLVMAMIMLWSDNLEYQLLTRFESGVYVSEDAAMSAAIASDERQQLVGIGYLLVFVVSVILIAQWVYSANQNARNLGAEGMEYTPGWSVGWYFIPIASLWKPYQAMKEIWRASHPTEDWRSSTRPGFLPWWWFLWITTSIVGQASFRMSMWAEEIDELIDLSVVNQVFDILEIPLALAFLAVVNSVHQRQCSTATRMSGISVGN